MSDETEKVVTETVKTASDGMVKITVEKYNEMLEKIAEQKGSISRLTEQVTQARNARPINQTIVEKTAAQAAEDHRLWGGSLMALGASTFIVGAIRFKLASRTGA